MMKTVYLVTEGRTDQVVISGLVQEWLAPADFVIRSIQPPSSDFAATLTDSLSEGWKGVLNWCNGARAGTAVSRAAVLRQADCLIIHIDTDVATDRDFRDPPFQGAFNPARPACDWMRERLASAFADGLPANVVLCVPSVDMDA